MFIPFFYCNYNTESSEVVLTMALRGLHTITEHDVKKFRTKSKSQWKKTTIIPKYHQLFWWLYEGQVMNDKNHGYGVLTKVYRNGAKKKCYAGQWKHGKMQGSGGYWYDSGSYFEGNFYDGERSGFGRMWHHDGHFYQGFWENNVYSGHGMLIYANGNRYEGEFLNGKKSGHGTFYHLRTGQMQEGDWISDVCIQSVMGDIGNRQSARKPTSHPIPMLST